MDQNSKNPFLEDIFVDHPGTLPGVNRMHQPVFAQILEAVESLIGSGKNSAEQPGVGRIFLMTAPEAGYGKSHLVARLRDHLGTIASTITLPFDRSKPVAWPVALSSVLRQLSARSVLRNQSITLLEEVSRYFLSRLVLDTLATGAVRDRDCPETAAKMHAEFASLFARDSDSKILAWVDRRSADLTRLSNPEFLANLGLGTAELGFWARVFVDLNLREEGALDRLRGLSNGEARERLLQLLRIATDYRPIMLVADGLDGFYSSETAGMEIAEIVNGIRERVPRSITLVCVNDDIWESVFEKHLPSAWLDRLTSEKTPLRAITPEAASDLIRARLSKTAISPTAAERFVGRLSTDHLWIDAETRVTPRTALRQAGDLWRREGGSFLKAPESKDTFDDLLEEPLENLTDKADFFQALNADRPVAVPVADSVADSVVKPITTFSTPPAMAPISSPPPIPTRAPEPVAKVANPFHADVPGVREVELAGIDSIISDIRGSGKTVVSEAPDLRFGGDTDLPPVTEPEIPAQSPWNFQPGSPAVAAPSHGFTGSPVSFSGVPKFSAQPAAPAKEARPLTRASLEQTLAEKEREILSGTVVTLDLERLERFIRQVGRQHAALGQQEERYPSSRTVCLRWNVRGHSVLTGFESPRNVYFWNNLLQQSLASNRQEKIVAFSHHSAPFDAAVFSSFGFSPTVIRGRIDTIEMNDRELAMLYAADQILQEFENSGDGEKAIQLITLHLDPLWRRMIQAV